MNTNELCDNITIQTGASRISCMGSLQSNTINNNNGNAQPLQDTSWTLYIKYPLISNNDNIIVIPSGTRITVQVNNDSKNQTFSVVSISDEMGIATILLSTKVGR
jgi:hypothetical protein